MAAPLVTGCVAVLRQALMEWYPPGRKTRNSAGRPPRAALIKALLINGADDLHYGEYRGNTIGPAPNNIQGHGRVNLEKSLRPIVESATGRQGIWEDIIKISELSRSVDRYPPAPIGASVRAVDSEIKVTLVFTDRPGPMMQFDLALSLVLIDPRGKDVTAPYVKRGDNVLSLKLRVNAGFGVRISVRADTLPKYGE